LWVALVAVVLLQVGVTHVGFLQSLFDTTDITALQWLVCTAVASTVLWVEEIRKFIVRKGSAA
jgi:Ca2+-transporting ATPase